jgi:hypothetical protein
MIKTSMSSSTFECMLLEIGGTNLAAGATRSRTELVDDRSFSIVPARLGLVSTRLPSCDRRRCGHHGRSVAGDGLNVVDNRRRRRRGGVPASPVLAVRISRRLGMMLRAGIEEGGGPGS